MPDNSGTLSASEGSVNLVKLQAVRWHIWSYLLKKRSDSSLKVCDGLFEASDPQVAPARATFMVL